MDIHSFCLRALCAVVLCAWPATSGYVPPTKYLIVSNPIDGTVAYAKLTGPGKVDHQMMPLITSGLVHPQGIAVDQKRQLLLVADSDPKTVFSYGLSVTSTGDLKVDEQTPLLEGIETRWVAVDGVGNVFATDEMENRLVKVTAKQVLDGDTTPHEVYSKTAGGVSAPGGVAADNFFLYWTNKLDAMKAGTVVRSLEMPTNDTSGSSFLGQNGASLEVLSSNSPKAYGVCVATDNVYYTDNAKNVFAVKKSGGSIATITGNLTSPRGCAWDGDSTVYVADRSQGAVFSFDGPVMDLMQMEASVNKVVDFSDAFGVAVFSSASRRVPLAALGALLLAVAA